MSHLVSWPTWRPLCPITGLGQANAAATCGPEQVSALAEDCGAEVVVVNGCGRREAVRCLEAKDVTSLRPPVGVAELRLACFVGRLQQTARPGGRKPKLAQVGDGERVRLAQASSAVQCECPPLGGSGAESQRF